MFGFLTQKGKFNYGIVSYNLSKLMVFINVISDSKNLILSLTILSVWSLGDLVTNIAFELVKSKVCFSSRSFCLSEENVITLLATVHFPFPYLFTSGGVPFRMSEW